MAFINYPIRIRTFYDDKAIVYSVERINESEIRGSYSEVNNKVIAGKFFSGMIEGQNLEMEELNQLANAINKVFVHIYKSLPIVPNPMYSVEDKLLVQGLSNDTFNRILEFSEKYFNFGKVVMIEKSTSFNHLHGFKRIKILNYEPRMNVDVIFESGMVTPLGVGSSIDISGGVTIRKEGKLLVNIIVQLFSH